MYTTIIKEGVKIVSNIGIGTIVGNAAKQVANPATMNTFNKVCVTVGGSVLASCIGAKVGEYTDKVIDDTVSGVKELFKNIKGKEGV